MIKRTCKGLKILKLNGIKVTNNISDIMQELFGQITSLELDNCANKMHPSKAIFSLFSKCANLESLKILKSVTFKNYIFDGCVFPKLTVLKTDALFEGSYINFFKKHRDITHLSMQNLPFSILNTCQNVESFRTVLNKKPSASDTKILENCDKLKELYLLLDSWAVSWERLQPFACTAIIRALAVNNTIESLELWDFDNEIDKDNELNAILSCTHLKSLKIGPYWTLKHDQWMRIPKCLSNLTTIYLSLLISDELVLEGLIKFIENCANLHELYMPDFFGLIESSYDTTDEIDQLNEMCEGRQKPLSIFTSEESYKALMKYRSQMHKNLKIICKDTCIYDEDADDYIVFSP